MNELKVTKTPGGLMVDSRDVAVMVEKNLTLLNDVCVRSLTEPNKLALLDELDLVTDALRHSYPFLMHAVRNLVVDSFFKVLPNEMDMHASFISRINEFLPTAEIIGRKDSIRHIPDLWVAIDGDEIPVEMKLNGFGPKALRQLQRYMFFYKSKQGIAVARSLNCEIPDNITFIEFSF